MSGPREPEHRGAGTPRRRRRLPRAAGSIGGVLLVVLAAVLPLLDINVPGVFPGPTYTPGTLQLLAFAMLIAALALSYHLLFGVAGMLSFGHALFFAVGAYGLGIILTEHTLAWLPPGLVFTGAVVFTLVLGLVLAAVVGSVSLRVGGISFAMVTLAFAQAGSDVLERNPGSATGGNEGLPLDTRHVPALLVGVANTAYLYWLCLGLLVVVYLVVLWIEASRAGHVAKGARENELRVRVLGMHPYWVRFAVFVVASALAVVCGMTFIVLQSGVTPSIGGSNFTLSLLVIVVLGGVGYRWGAVAGGIIYTLLDQRLGALAGSSAIAGLPPILRIPLSEPLFILGAIFILVVIFVPGGIAGTVQRFVSDRPPTGRTARDGRGDAGAHTSAAPASSQSEDRTPAIQSTAGESER